MSYQRLDHDGPGGQDSENSTRLQKSKNGTPQQRSGNHEQTRLESSPSAVSVMSTTASVLASSAGTECTFVSSLGCSPLTALTSSLTSSLESVLFFALP